MTVQDINFNQTPYVQVSKTWGWETWIVNNESYCGKILVVYPNKHCSIHYHKKKKETFYVLDGSLLLSYVYDNYHFKSMESGIHNGLDLFNFCTVHRVVLNKGDSITLDTYTPHWFTSNSPVEPCKFLEISTHHDDNDSYRIERGSV